jgi:hypothetical protein
MDNDLNVLALFKGAERFIFVFDDAGRQEALDAIRDKAADPSVSLNWSDAAMLIERAKQVGEQAPADADPADEEPVRFEE